MSENKLSENITYYRKKKGLSQEKIAEYLNVSRQAVSKWESGISRPSAENLIRLSQLLEVDLEILINSKEDTPQPAPEEVSPDRTPWILIGISTLLILTYIIAGALMNTFHIGVLICMFVLCIPIQLFLHLYFSYAIKANDFYGIAGFDDKIQYHIPGVKKLLMQIDLQIGILSTVTIFLLGALNCIRWSPEWINGILFAIYILNFILGIELCNYKMANQIYLREEDKMRARRAIPVTMLYTLSLAAGIALIIIVFEVKGIENNTLPAMKAAGLLIAGMLCATAGLFIENNRINKWDTGKINYTIGKATIVSFLLCAIFYVLLCL